MSTSLRSQLRATYQTCRKLGLLASEAYAIALIGIRFPARRSHYMQAFHHVLES